jgi:RNA polymerase sigma factor (sigma-70 family)
LIKNVEIDWNLRFGHLIMRDNMEASVVPRPAPAGVTVFKSPVLLRLAPDAHLVALIREGRPAAFETVYDRHHRSILSFCRHMLGDPDEAQDAVQHTFLAAYNDLISSSKQVHLRAWLFTIARNRCYSILRSRREHPTSQLTDAVTEGLATQVQRREDLRDLVGDMRQLPQEQRAALVLAEIDSLSHQEIGDVLGVPKDKVKALVFQARESLIASRTARETDCAEIREQLATQRGGSLRRSNLRRHLRDCAGCREYRKQIERQRRQLAIALPVVGTVAMKDSVVGVVAGGAGAGAVGGGLLAGSILKGGGIGKLVLGTLIGALGAAGTLVATSDLDFSGNSPAQPLMHKPVSVHSAGASASSADSRLHNLAAAGAHHGMVPHALSRRHRRAVAWMPAHRHQGRAGRGTPAPARQAHPGYRAHGVRMAPRSVPVAHHTAPASLPASYTHGHSGAAHRGFPGHRHGRGHVHGHQSHAAASSVSSTHTSVPPASGLIRPGHRDGSPGHGNGDGHNGFSAPGGYGNPGGTGRP